MDKDITIVEEDILKKYRAELDAARKVFPCCEKLERIGVLTSGGDAPGMNALIRGVARTALFYDLEVYGIRRGFSGLCKGEIEELHSRELSDTIQRGGTFLRSARSKAFMTEDGMNKALAMVDAFNLDCVFCIGGDGTWKGANSLAEAGIPVMALPATIDNDIGASEYSIGFDTAINTAMEAVDKLKDTSSSHERCSVVEVMGRDSGHLAMAVGIACGAEIILTPEHPLDMMDDVVGKIISARNRGKSHYIVIIAEGVGEAENLAKKIQEFTDIESRGTNLGYIQRGGSPSVRDRYISSLMAVHAVRTLLQGRCNRAVVLKDGTIQDIGLEEAIKIEKQLSEEVLHQADILSF